MEKSKKKVKKSVLPWYLAAAVWVLMLFFPIHSMVAFVVLGVVISAAVFVVSKLIFRNKVIEEPEPEEAESKEEAKKEEGEETSGDSEIDKLMEEGDRAISEMRRLNRNIEDPEISRQIDALEQVTMKIFDHVIQNPEKLPQIRKFLNYYLPTTLKLLNAYDRMGSQGVSGENIDGTMDKVEAMMETIVEAFQRQLDELFGAEAMDIAADITVLENMMYREGLIDKPFKTEDHD